ncbi:MAG: zf-HC2 domain-containing protein [Anaerolineae bacterium]|nr:zf-HC2 domain-containing protein [Anaerolineae bacterium]
MTAMYEQPVDLTLLSAYLDGEVTQEERTRVEAQLRVSPAWREELESLRWTVNLLRELPDMPMPRSFELPVLAETAPAATSRLGTRERGWRLDLGWLYGFFRTSAAVTVALLLAVVGLDVWQTRGDLAREVLTAQSPASAPAPQALSQPAAGTAPEAARNAQPAAPTIAPDGKALQNPAAQATFPAGAAAPPRPGSGGGGVPGGGGGGLGGGDGTGGVGSTSEGGLPLVATPAPAAGDVQSSVTPDTQSALTAKAQPQAQAQPNDQRGTMNEAQGAPVQAQGRPWRGLEFLFAGLTIALVVGAWAVRRRMTKDG